MFALLVLFWILPPLVILGFVLGMSRTRPARLARREQPDPVENNIIPQEWELVRREHCLPTKCRRTIGSPARPRKDAHCEICAAMFLNAYWRRMLDGGAASEGLRSPSMRGERSDLISLEVNPVSTDVRPGVARRGARWGEPRRWITALFVGGVPLFLAGALLALLTPYALAGYALVGFGLLGVMMGAVSLSD